MGRLHEERTVRALAIALQDGGAESACEEHTVNLCPYRRRLFVDQLKVVQVAKSLARGNRSADSEHLSDLWYTADLDDSDQDT